MKKVLLSIVLTGIYIGAYAQVPYWGATVGKKKVYGYTSVKFRPGINAIQSYTTLQFGVTDWFSLGTDLYADKETVDHGLYVRFGKKWNKWISTGIQASYMSNLRDNYKFSNVNIGLIFNGYILPSGYLTWTSNTWLTFNCDGTNTYEHWLYLGSNIVFNENHSLYPMIGIFMTGNLRIPLTLLLVLGIHIPITAFIFGAMIFLRNIQELLLRLILHSNDKVAILKQCRLWK